MNNAEQKFKYLNKQITEAKSSLEILDRMRQEKISIIEVLQASYSEASKNYLDYLLEEKSKLEQDEVTNKLKGFPAQRQLRDKISRVEVQISVMENIVKKNGGQE